MGGGTYYNRVILSDRHSNSSPTSSGTIHIFRFLQLIKDPSQELQSISKSNRSAGAMVFLSLFVTT